MIEGIGLLPSLQLYLKMNGENHSKCLVLETWNESIDSIGLQCAPCKSWNYTGAGEVSAKKTY